MVYDVVYMQCSNGMTDRETLKILCTGTHMVVSTRGSSVCLYKYEDDFTHAIDRKFCRYFSIVNS